jgi:MoxR-like ATPase
MFASIQDAVHKLAAQNYICTREAATVVYLACAMRKPLLVEGPAGVGKTELAKAVAGALALDLIRLQCYEGLDEAKALYEWEYTKQLLYTQILKDKIGEVLSGARDLREAVECIAKEDDIFFSEKFLLPRPLLRALVSPEPAVLLVDEVDKSDTEFEAFLLEVLSDFQISVPELGTLKAKHVPFVVLTSNSSREMSDALKRRCLHLHLDFPSPKTEAAIIRLKVPGAGRKLAEDVVRFVYRLRRLDLKKPPSISESLDWVRALVLLKLRNLARPKVEDTLGSLVKHEGDARKAADELKKFLTERDVSAPASKSAGEKDLLH